MLFGYEEDWREVVGLLYLGTLGLVGTLVHSVYKSKIDLRQSNLQIIKGTAECDTPLHLTNMENEECVYIERSNTQNVEYKTLFRSTTHKVKTGPYKVSAPSFSVKDLKNPNVVYQVLNNERISFSPSLMKAYINKGDVDNIIEESSLPRGKELFFLGQVEVLQPVTLSLKSNNNELITQNEQEVENNNNNDSNSNKYLLKRKEGYHFVVGSSKEEVELIALSNQIFDNEFFLIYSIIANLSTLFFTLRYNNFYFKKQRMRILNQYRVIIQSFHDGLSQVEQVEVTYRFKRDENSQTPVEFNLHAIALLFENRILLDTPHRIISEPNRLVLQYFSTLKRRSFSRLFFIRLMKMIAIGGIASSLFSLCDIISLVPHFSLLLYNR